MKIIDFEAGALLHSVVIAAFRANGSALYSWCLDNGVSATACRNATHGINGSDAGRVLLNEIIDGAGRETVEMLYRQRMPQAVDRMAS